MFIEQGTFQQIAKVESPCHLSYANIKLYFTYSGFIKGIIGWETLKIVTFAWSWIFWNNSGLKNYTRQLLFVVIYYIL